MKRIWRYSVIADYSKRVWQEWLMRGHRLWYLIALAGIVYSFLTAQYLFLGIASLVLLLTGFIEIWFRLLPHVVRFQASVDLQRAHIGEVVTLEIQVSNPLPFAISWLELRSLVANLLEPLDGTLRRLPFERNGLLIDVLTLKAGERLTYQHRFFCQGRGCFQPGRAVLQSSDPLGWLNHEEERAATTPECLVYPLVAPLADLNLPALHPFGELATKRRLIPDPIRIAGIREYVPGDDPRLIHWKASARMGDLYSKVLDPSGSYRFLVLMNVNADAGYHSYVEDDILELHITTTASIAQWALDEGYAAGILANALLLEARSEEEDAADSEKSSSGKNEENMFSQGKNKKAATQVTDEMLNHLLWLPPDGRDSQAERILTSLTRIDPVPGLPLESLIDLYRFAFRSRTTIIVVSALKALRTETITALMELRMHGLSINLVLTGPLNEPLHLDTYDLPVYRIGGKEVWHALIKQARAEANADSPLPALQFL